MHVVVDFVNLSARSVTMFDCYSPRTLLSINKIVCNFMKLPQAQLRRDLSCAATSLRDLIIGMFYGIAKQLYSLTKKPKHANKTERALNQN